MATRKRVKQGVVFERTAMGQDLYDLIQLIKKIPIRKGRKREAAITHIAKFCEAFKEQWGRDPLVLMAILVDHRGRKGGATR